MKSEREGKNFLWLKVLKLVNLVKKQLKRKLIFPSWTLGNEMKKEIKIILIGQAVFWTLTGFSFGLGYIWWKGAHKKFISYKKTQINEGLSFGNGKKSSECISESLSRLKVCKNSLCHAGIHYFMRSCLNAGLGDSSACSEVPSRAPASVKDVYWWRKEVCKKMQSRNSFACFRLMGNIQAFCHPNIKKKEVF